ncbi:hypothetical protein [Dechloromonas denitrificans]|uniref:hypothetical protein n=1 Tax=Dechloromonas denitrificans TaxID=281362 RepID=UPI001CFBBB76|nr:hypothetical protein [Dechloromonas denitrificans]UCV09920.1 hypothetical protein KI615_10570 [Dechloromonas denitrificans]
MINRPKRPQAKKAPRNSTPSQVKKLWDETSNTLKWLIGFLGISAAGVATYFLPFIEPLKQEALHMIWNESPNVRLLCEPCILTTGQSVRINVVVSPNSKADVAKSYITLKYDPKVLAISPETNQSFESNIITSPKRLDKYFVLYPSQDISTQIKSEISVSLETKYGIYESEPISILVDPARTPAHIPFIEPFGKKGVNLSGEWRIELGGSLGGMKIQQNEHHDISGIYWLNNQKGKIEEKIEGYADGTTFKVFFFKSNSPSRWRIDANYSINQGFVEVKGCAFSIHPDKSIQSDSAPQGMQCVLRNFPGWKGDGATNFYAMAQLRH